MAATNKQREIQLKEYARDIRHRVFFLMRENGEYKGHESLLDYELNEYLVEKMADVFYAGMTARDVALE